MTLCVFYTFHWLLNPFLFVSKSGILGFIFIYNIFPLGCMGLLVINQYCVHPTKIEFKPLLHYAFLELRWARKCDTVCVRYT